MIRQSTTRNLMVFMCDSTDHVTGKTGLTLAITASKDGAAFASISPTVTERGNGWYALALTSSHTDTIGDLALHITSSGADPVDLVREVNSWEDKLVAHAGAVLKAVVGNGSTTTAVVLSTVDGATPSATDDFYNGRVVAFTSGALAGQATTVVDYNGTTKTATVSILTSAPVAAATAVIV